MRTSAWVVQPNRIELLPLGISHPRVSSISGKHVSRHSAAAAMGSHHVATICPQTRYSNLKLCSMNNRKYFPFGDLVRSMRTSAWVVQPNRIELLPLGVISPLVINSTFFPSPLPRKALRCDRYFTLGPVAATRIITWRVVGCEQRYYFYG